MIGHGLTKHFKSPSNSATVKLLLIAVASLLLLLTIQGVSAVSWNTVQSDSGTMASPEIGWHTVQSDSGTMASPAQSWHNKQYDTGIIETPSVGWHNKQYDNNTMPVSLDGWYMMQNDSSYMEVLNQTWYSMQNDSRNTTVLDYTWYPVQSDSSDYFVIPPTLSIWSSPPLTVNVNETYSYVWYATTDSQPMTVTMESGPSWLHCGTLRLYGVALYPGNYSISLKFQDTMDTIYQNYTLQVIGDAIPEPPAPDEDFGFAINMRDLLLWGVVVFIPIAILVIFGLLVRNSRR